MSEDKADGGRTKVEQRIEFRSVRDLPVVVVTKDELLLIAEQFEGRALPIARSLWLSMLELADVGAEFVATRRDVADRAGVSKRVLDEYVPRFIDAEMLTVELQQDERGKSLPSRFVLSGVQQRGRATLGIPPSSSSSKTPADGDEEQRGGTEPHPPGGIGSWEGVEPSIAADAQTFLKAKRREHGRIVTEPEMLCAAHALTAWNRNMGSEFGLGSQLQRIVGQVRDHPSWPPDKYVRLVDSAWRLKWWENSGRGRRPTPAVVFGNANVFEQVALDAAAEAAGKAPADTPERRSRFARTVEPE